MGKKKKRQLKPWCYYCDREFEDDKVLVNHQRSKHFKCMFCPRRFNLISGLVGHVEQVHKERVKRVPNALQGRDTTDLEIFGMEGVPEAELRAHEAKVMGSLGEGKRPRISLEDLAPDEQEEVYAATSAPSPAVVENSGVPTGETRTETEGTTGNGHAHTYASGIPPIPPPSVPYVYPLPPANMGYIPAAVPFAYAPSTWAPPPPHFAQALPASVPTIMNPGSTTKSAQDSVSAGAIVSSAGRGDIGVRSLPIAGASQASTAVMMAAAVLGSTSVIPAGSTVPSTVKSTRLVYEDESLSLEERRANAAQYRIHASAL